MQHDEQITVSPKNDPNRLLTYPRQKFYDEAFSGNSSTTMAVHVISMFIVTPEGELLLQKRSGSKRHNARLIDKTLGGHITFGDNSDYTVMVETVQELSTPSIVLRNDDDFAKTYELLRRYLDVVAIVKYVETHQFDVVRVVEGKEYTVTNVTHTYFGVYNGRTKPADREAAGMLYYSFEELKQELVSTPNVFTDDLRTYFEFYGTKLADFVEEIKNFTV